MTTTKYMMSNTDIPMVTFEVTEADSEYLLREKLNGRRLSELLADEDELTRVCVEMENADIAAVLPGWYHAMDLGPTTNWETGPFDTEDDALADIPRHYGSSVTEGPEPEPYDANEAYLRTHLAQLLSILASAPVPNQARPQSE